MHYPSDKLPDIALTPYNAIFQTTRVIVRGAFFSGCPPLQVRELYDVCFCHLEMRGEEAEEYKAAFREIFRECNPFTFISYDPKTGGMLRAMPPGSPCDTALITCF